MELGCRQRNAERCGRKAVSQNAGMRSVDGEGERVVLELEREQGLLRYAARSGRIARRERVSEKAGCGVQLRG